MSTCLRRCGGGAPCAVAPDRSITPRVAEGGVDYEVAWPAPTEDDKRIEGNVGAVADATRREPSAGAPGIRRASVSKAPRSAPVARSVPVAIYVRHGIGRRGRTLEDQLDACRRAAPGIVGDAPMYATFTDDAAGHAATARLGLRALMRAGRSRDFDVLFVESPDRLSRDSAQIERIWAELDGLGIVVASAQTGRLEKVDVTVRGMLADAARAARRRGR